ncbi:Arylsulfatase B [Hypsibius exemplaris]|uniref:Arylsulfatase B n=1 Tax=Hypsibius exemplaris TaxID=2072580 RepID=A0A1W0WT21_HYPEX|nr:Arylsulfatase B [Hypsibius exemplaris]
MYIPRLVLGSILYFFPHVVAERQAKQRPNIILIVADDLGWNDVSFHGSQQIPTPNIDRLARQGIILNNYYVTPICTPSRSSLLTGKYPIHLGTQHNVLNGVEPWGLGLEEITLPQYLKKGGYVNHIVGKWHLGFFSENYLPTNRGFDSHFGYWLGHSDYFDHSGQEWGDWGLDLRNNLDVVRNLTGRYATDLFTKRAERIIHTHNTSTPLFLYLAHLAVHSANEYDPLQTTKRYYDRFPHIKHEGRRLFAGMVAGLDESVGRVYRSLKDRGMDKNSVIVFTTDNGGPAASFDYNYANNWPLRGVKDTLWEGGVRGSAFIWSPLLKNTGRVSTQLMHISDWLPTILSAAELNDVITRADINNPIDGIDQWSALSENTPSARTEVLLNIDHDRNVYALRVKNYKIILGTTYNGDWDNWYPPEGTNITYASMKQAPAAVKCAPPLNPGTPQSCMPLKGPCLFDLANDPCEYHNLADQQPEVLQRMLDRLTIYNTTVVPPRNQPPDPAGKPERHGYVWAPWK